MKNYAPFPSSLESISYFSFFGVRNLKAVEGIFMVFPTKIWFSSFLSDGKKKISNLKHITSHLVDLFMNVRKNSLLNLLYFPFKTAY